MPTCSTAALLLVSFLGIAAAGPDTTRADVLGAPYPFVCKWRGMHPADDASEVAVGLCTASLVAKSWILTAGHCATRMLKHEKVNVKVTFTEGKNVERGVTHCVHAPKSEDVALCKLKLPVGHIEPVAVSSQLFKTAGPHTGPVMCVGTYHGLHATGPKTLEYESSGGHLYVNNAGGSGMHAGDSGGAWLRKFTVNASSSNTSSNASSSNGTAWGLVGVIHGGEGSKGHKRGVACQPAYFRSWIDSTTNHTVRWVTGV